MSAAVSRLRHQSPFCSLAVTSQLRFSAIATGFVTQVEPDRNSLSLAGSCVVLLRCCLLLSLPILQTSVMLLHQPVSFCTRVLIQLGAQRIPPR
jgi:hypothetical protein